MTSVETTWDGLPIAADSPRGAMVVVRRAGSEGEQFLLLHRHHHGPDHVGDWAWTPPAGARLPGEAILQGAVRELGEEAGLADVDLRPVDLSGGWALFAAEVDPTTPIVIDCEHDRYDWLGSQAALALLAPDIVAQAFRRASVVALPKLTFRPMTRHDLPDMVSWQQTPHVRQWWVDNLADAAAAEAKYGPRIDGLHPVRVDVLIVDGAAAGFLQSYRTADYPDYAQTLGDTEAIAIDYALADPALVGQRIGTQAIWVYLRDVVLPRYPHAPRVLATPSIENMRSIRALLKAGFQRFEDMTAPTPAGPQRQALCVLDRARVFGVQAGRQGA